MLSIYETSPAATNLEGDGAVVYSGPASGASQVESASTRGNAQKVAAPRGRRVSQSKVMLCLNQLAVMTQNGVEIADALRNVSANCADERLGKSLSQIHDAVSSGTSLSVAVDRFGVYFPITLAPMLSAAEATGEVPRTLSEACIRLRGEMQMRGAVIGALIYPVILISASFIVMTALVMGVLPQFSKVFASLGRPVPASTQLLLSFGEFCRSYWMIIAPVAVALLVAIILMRHHPILTRPFRRLFMYGPIIRGAYRPLIAGQNFRTLAAMLRGGVPVLQAVQMTRRTTKDPYWQALHLSVEENLIDGRMAATAFDDVDFLPSEAAQMVHTAERTGRLGEVLEQIGEFYEEEATRRIKRLIVALEPCVILSMGVVVAGVVMSVMLPLLEVSSIR
ncbi:MAG: type II secretion system F family protein [Planctomycetota bacterium]